MRKVQLVTLILLLSIFNLCAQSKDNTVITKEMVLEATEIKYSSISPEGLSFTGLHHHSDAPLFWSNYTIFKILMVEGDTVKYTGQHGSIVDIGKLRQFYSKYYGIEMRMISPDFTQIINRQMWYSYPDTEHPFMSDVSSVLNDEYHYFLIKTVQPAVYF